MCPSSAGCCSQYGYCGVTTQHCTSCKTAFSFGGKCAATSAPPPSAPATSSNGQCGPNSGRCPSASPCCSEFGWCGTSSTHCSSCKNSLYYFNGDCSSSSGGTSGSTKSQCGPVPPNVSTCAKGSSYYYNFKTANSLSNDFTRSFGSITFPGTMRFTMRQEASVLLKWKKSTQYGSYSVRMRAPAISGAVTAAIFISPRGDETDVEIVGKDPNNFQSNIFYQGILSYNEYNQNHFVSGGYGNAYNTYLVEWTPTEIRWKLNGVLVRTYKKSTSYSAKYGKCMYPEETVRV